MVATRFKEGLGPSFTRVTSRWQIWRMSWTPTLIASLRSSRFNSKLRWKRCPGMGLPSGVTRVIEGAEDVRQDPDRRTEGGLGCDVTNFWMEKMEFTKFSEDEDPISPVPKTATSYSYHSPPSLVGRSPLFWSLRLTPSSWSFKLTWICQFGLGRHGHLLS